MDEVLSATLSGAVDDRLAYLTTLAETSDASSRAALTLTEIPHLVEVIREMLADHTPDQRGRCHRCSRRPWRRSTGCAIWWTAYRHLIGDSSPPTLATRRHSLGHAPVIADTKH